MQSGARRYVYEEDRTMKKKLTITAVLMSTVMAAAACGSQQTSAVATTQSVETTALETTEMTVQETAEEADETEEVKASSGEAKEDTADDLLVIREQGYFTAGGTVRTNEGEFHPGDAYSSRDGQTIHGDHASVFYQVPEDAKQNPMVFLHGITQSGKCWSTTADGREGFANLFLRDGYPVYLVDQPRRGQAGQSTEDGVVLSDAGDQMYFEQFRIGQWPEFYDGVQFPQDDASVDEFFRQMTPDVGTCNIDAVIDGLVATFEKTGPGILVTHSAGGAFGWPVAIESGNVTGIVALEPGTFVFPEGEVPDPIDNIYSEISGIQTYPMVVSQEEFEKLTRMPIIIYYGDYIPDEPCENPGQDYWRSSRDYALLFAETVNRHGGDATVIELPKEGIYGNTHFIMSDLNNVEIADHISAWLKEKGLGQ